MKNEMKLSQEKLMTEIVADNVNGINPLFDADSKQDSNDIDSLSKEKVEELYKIYLKLRTEYLQKCNELELIEEYTDKLFDMFESFKSN